MVLASEMRMEVSLRDPPLIPGMPFRPALYLSLRPSLLMASLFPFLRSFSVRPFLGLLHPPVVLTRLRMPISTLRLLVLPPLALRSHLPPVSTLRLLVATVIIATIFRPCLFLRPSLFLPILRLRILLLFVLVLILRDGHPRRSQQQRSATPTHD